MYKGKKVSVVFPAYNEEKNIAEAIHDFQKLHFIDQIIVVDNNSKDKTAEKSFKEGAYVVSEKRQGYGFALRKGMSQATGDYIILCEPDGTFQAKDAQKLLRYLEKYDVVVGTRTNKKFIGKNANMKGLLRWGNILLAKITQILYQSPSSLSDCGCTFRVMKKEIIKKILTQLKVGGSHFLSELLVVTLKEKYTLYEVPVHYRKRVGESKITGSLLRSFVVGFAMMQVMLGNKFNFSRNQKLLLFIGSITFVFCVAIIINISPFLLGPAPFPPNWRWLYSPTPLSLKILVPFLIISGIFVAIYNYEKNIAKQRNIVKMLLLFLLLGFLLQLSLVYASRAGIGVLLHRILNPMINGYFTVSLTKDSLPFFLHYFTSNLGNYPMYAKFHPPGAILFFSLINAFTSTLSFLFPLLEKVTPRHADVAIIWKGLTSAQRLSAFISGYVVALLSYTTIIPLYLSAKLLYGKKTALRSVLLFLFIPSILLFIPLNDAFLPLFTAWSLYFFLLGINSDKLIFTFLSGFVLFIGTFFSLTFLPLLLFFFIFLILQKSIRYSVNLFLSFLLGFLILPFLLFVFYQFNFITMTQKMMFFHETAQTGRNYWVWLFYNLYDFFMFVGVPIALLFFYKIRTLLQDTLFIAFLAMLIILDLNGSVRGETARIWLPFVPLVILPIANLVTNLKFTSRQLLFLITLQMMQVIIFQLFLVTLW